MPNADAGTATGLDPDASTSIAALLAASEPTGPRDLGDLILRLDAAGRLRGVAAPGPSAIRGVAFDSRSVGPSSIFVAVPGGHLDGHDFVVAAVSRGAIAAVVERAVPGVGVPQIVVDDARRALAVVAAWWYRDPSLELGVVGITGTDGKTTTAFLCLAVLEEAGVSTGLISTAGLKVGAIRSANAEHVTTPESPRLQQTLRAMVGAGNRAAIVETTSHGLALSRVAEIAYDIAIFTNLTHEHLELHGTFDAYREAKLSLFRGLGATGDGERLARPWPRTAIVNVDDPAAPLFIAAAREAGAAVLTYGESAGADVRAVAVGDGAQSLQVDIATPRWSSRVDLQLAGRFNALNATAAVALGEALGLDPEAICRGLSRLAGVPGRMERINCGQPFGVLIDYAHSPASLEKVLDILAPIASVDGGGLVGVFGSAGERDVQKRPMMGRVAAERCRLVVLTDEDPRGEDGDAIIDQIAAGAESAGKVRGSDLLCIRDRRAAIAAAFAQAGRGDIVLLAGKGHEQSIIMEDGPRPWDEHAEAMRALADIGYCVE